MGSYGFLWVPLGSNGFQRVASGSPSLTPSSGANWSSNSSSMLGSSNGAGSGRKLLEAAAPLPVGGRSAPCCSPCAVLASDPSPSCRCRLRPCARVAPPRPGPLVGRLQTALDKVQGGKGKGKGKNKA